MKIQHALCFLVIVLAAILAVLILNQPEGKSRPVQPHDVAPRDHEKFYRDIDRELKEKDRRGIGHINPGDALRPPSGILPPEY
jgi:hypothetical protein